MCRQLSPILALALTIVASETAAHPVAQGSMEVTVYPEYIDVRIRAANEECFLAEAFREGSARHDLNGMYKSHGLYLLHHVFVIADGKPLKGALVDVSRPADQSAIGSTNYRLHFPLPLGETSPGMITIRQTVLNEFEFTPGSRWEASYVVRISQAGGAAQEGLLLVAQKPLEFACQWENALAAQSVTTLDSRLLFRAYLRHGVMHILTGYDHMLFMGALILAVASLWDLVKVVTAFTLAHTVTLTLCVLGLVRLPTWIVEPMIAASIVVVAVQNIFMPEQTRGWFRLLVAFGFGLFHGLGFASGLLEAMSALPGISVAIAIVAFSIGVECGHQIVVLPVFSTLNLAGRMVSARGGHDITRYYSMKVGSTVVCLGGLLYLVAALRHEPFRPWQ